MMGCFARCGRVCGGGHCSHEDMCRLAVHGHEMLLCCGLVQIRSYSHAPGVRPERLEEAFQVRHCALSLVGEPIMYPHINK